jgi:hypothetical protein
MNVAVDSSLSTCFLVPRGQPGMVFLTQLAKGLPKLFSLPPSPAHAQSLNKSTQQRVRHELGQTDSASRPYKYMVRGCHDIAMVVSKTREGTANLLQLLPRLGLDVSPAGTIHDSDYDPHHEEPLPARFQPDGLSMMEVAPTHWSVHLDWVPSQWAGRVYKVNPGRFRPAHRVVGSTHPMEYERLLVNHVVESGRWEPDPSVDPRLYCLQDDEPNELAWRQEEDAKRKSMVSLPPPPSVEENEIRQVSVHDNWEACMWHDLQGLVAHPLKASLAQPPTESKGKSKDRGAGGAETQEDSEKGLFFARSGVDDEEFFVLQDRDVPGRLYLFQNVSWQTLVAVTRATHPTWEHIRKAPRLYLNAWACQEEKERLVFTRRTASTPLMRQRYPEWHESVEALLKAVEQDPEYKRTKELLHEWTTFKDEAHRHALWWIPAFTLRPQWSLALHWFLCHTHSCVGRTHQWIKTGSPPWQDESVPTPSWAEATVLWRRVVHQHALVAARSSDVFPRPTSEPAPGDDSTRKNKDEHIPSARKSMDSSRHSAQAPDNATEKTAPLETKEDSGSPKEAGASRKPEKTKASKINGNGWRVVAHQLAVCRDVAVALQPWFPSLFRYAEPRTPPLVADDIVLLLFLAMREGWSDEEAIRIWSALTLPSTDQLKKLCGRRDSIMHKTIDMAETFLKTMLQRMRDKAGYVQALHTLADKESDRLKIQCMRQVKAWWFCNGQLNPSGLHWWSSLPTTESPTTFWEPSSGIHVYSLDVLP